MSLPHAVGETAAEVGKAIPPVSVAGLSLAGVPLSDWVLLATLVYTLLQIGVLIYSKILKRKSDEPRS